MIKTVQQEKLKNRSNVKFNTPKPDDKRNNLDHSCINNFIDITEQIKSPNYHE